MSQFVIGHTRLQKAFELVRSCGLKKLLLGDGSTGSGLINSWLFPCHVAEISAKYQDEVKACCDN